MHNDVVEHIFYVWGELCAETTRGIHIIISHAGEQRREKRMKRKRRKRKLQENRY